MTEPEKDELATGAKPSVPAVERTMLILRTLQREGSLTLTGLLHETGLNKSSCYYLLQTLVRERLVEHDQPTRRYRLGVGLVELGSAAADQLSYIGVAKRYLAELLEDIDATFILYRRATRSSVVLLDKLERPRRVRITVPIGGELPIQGGSFGRCFLAYDPPDVVDEALAEGLHQFTQRSVTDVEAFRRDLEVVRRRGWTVDHQGFSEGISTVAAAIFDGSGEPLLVVGAVAITSTLDDATVEDWGHKLRDVCDRVGLSLGARRASWPRLAQASGGQDEDLGRGDR
jgi:DNA-binding IclR family transcriptional regulator